MEPRQRRRQPRGIPAGGQYARERGVAGTVELSDPVVEHVFDAVGVAARRAARRYRNVDAEELRSTTVVEFLALARRDTARVREWNAEPVEAEKYAMVIVRNTAWRMANPYANSKERSANKRLAAAADAYRAAHNGQPVPPAERNEFAERVRATIPARQRPGRDYWRSAGAFDYTREHRLLDADRNDDGSVLERAVARRLRDADHDSGGHVAARVEVAVDAVLSVRDHAVDTTSRQAARGICLRATYRGVEAMFRARGDHLPDVASIGEQRARAANKVVQSAGGVAALCSRWANGTTTSAENDALFTPWGRPSSRAGQGAVVTMLQDLGPARGAAAWTSALAIARPHPTEAPL